MNFLKIRTITIISYLKVKRAFTFDPCCTRNGDESD